MPTMGYLRMLLKRADEQVRALKGGLRHIGGQIEKLQKKQAQFEALFKFRTKDVEEIQQQIAKLEHDKEKTLKTLS